MVQSFIFFTFFYIDNFYNKQEMLDEKIQNLKNQILVVSSNTIPGKEIKEILGIVRGISDTSASSDAEFKLAEKEALFKIMEESFKLGANAIVDLKSTTGSYQRQGSQWMVSKVIYIGTAVKIQ